MVTQAQLIGRYRAAQAKDLYRRGLKVQSRARLLLSGAGAGHPKRVDTGHLRSSVQVQLRQYGAGKPAVRIGTNVRYARWVHDGTGLYGPRRRLIRPKRAKVLRFSGRRYGKTGYIYARHVKGMKPNAFLEDALIAARD
jgi:hypothetical protein